MISFEEFKQYVTEEIRSALPEQYRNAEVSVKDITKSNDITLAGLIIRNDEDMVTPTIYLDAYYEEYKAGRRLPAVLKEIAAARVANERDDLVDLNTLRDWEQVKDKIFPKMVNADSNREYLSDKPHREVEDLAVSYVIDVTGHGREHLSTPVTFSLLEQYGVTENELHETALKNLSGTEMYFKSMRDTLIDMIQSGEMSSDMASIMSLPPVEKKPLLYTLSNTDRINGVAVILDPKKMEKVSKELDGDFFLLPSSVHEWVVLRKQGDEDLKQMEQNIAEVNSTAVSPDMQLSGHAYYYDTKAREVIRADRVLNPLNAELPMEPQKDVQEETTQKGRENPMMTRYQEISALAEYTSRQVARNGQEWTKYLDTAARLYKYPFHEQLLIYAQRPQATACASIDVWNEKMHCWVNRGAKGIALIDTNSARPKLKYVFDVADVHKARRIGRDPNLWKLKYDQRDKVLETLEKTYGATDTTRQFEQRIMEIADRIAMDSYKELLPELSYAAEGSALEELDDFNRDLILRETLKSSLSYVLLSRCGANMEQWRGELDFSHISDFNTTKVLSVVGNATTELAKPVLMEIGKSISEMERQEAAERAARRAAELEQLEAMAEAEQVEIGKENPPASEKNSQNAKEGLANISDTDYNALKRESETQDRQTKTPENEAKEGMEHETDIRKERGLSDPESDGERGAGGDAYEVRTAAEGILEGAPERDLSGHDTDGRAEGALSGDSEAGRGENGAIDGADRQGGESGRNTQGSRSDEMGEPHEQYPAESGGERTGGTDLRIESENELNTEGRETGNEELSSPVSFSEGEQVSEEDLKRGILCSDEFLIHNRSEIAGYFNMEQDTKLQAEYLKNCFPQHTYFALNISGTSVGFHADDHGLYMNLRGTVGAENEDFMSWEDARFLVSGYMADGVYLLPGETAEQIDTNGMYKQLDLFTMFTEQVGTVAAAEAEVKDTPPAMFTLPETQIDDILRTGSGHKESRKRIYAKYTEGKTPEEMTDFLKKEYATTGKGFMLDENPISAWFDPDSMKLGYGTSAKENPFMSLGWAEIENRIRGMVEEGTYMSGTEAFLVDQYERQRVADKLWNFFRDGVGSMPEDFHIPMYGYPESVAGLAELLSTPEGRKQVTGELRKSEAAIDAGELTLRWRFTPEPKELLSEIADLGADRIRYPLAENVQIRLEDFITQDEIDHALTRGSGIEHGKFRIYDYFREGHSKEENISFLKNEYGTGGHAPALVGADQSNEEHDAKGIELSKGSIIEPYTEVLLKWNIVEKRINELITEDKYLSPKDKEGYLTYKAEQEQTALKKAQEEMEKGLRVDCKNAIEMAIKEHFDGYHLSHEAADAVLREYGADRVSYILANTVTQLSYDGRFSADNKEWAKQLVPTAMIEAENLIVTSHRAVLDGFIGLVRENIEREKAQSIDGEEEIPLPEPPTSGHDVQKSEELTTEEPELKEPMPEEPEQEKPVPDKSNAQNYRITDDALGAGGAKEKFRRNVEAIQTLRQIESENRIATPAEQEILSRYVGWGGLSDAFDASKPKWAAEYAELKELLSDKEYAAARGSTLNSHYTSPVIIRSIYEGLEKMGFEKGNILEPSMGIGNFFGMLPESLGKSKLYGVELDDITGRIAKQLYPQADVQIKGFEKTDYPNDFFDVAVGNVPFGQYKVADKLYDRQNFLIHDYFFAKTLDKVRPGGVVAFITSKGTMDKKTPDVRKYLAQRAELLGAIRLPETAFKENAGAEVTSDILFFKKRDRLMDIEPDWVHLAENEDGISVNSYFVEHPEMIMGKMEMVSGQYGMESTCLPDTSRPLGEQLREAISHLDGQIEAVELSDLEEENSEKESVDVIPADPNVKNFSYTLVDGQVYYRENSVMHSVNMPDNTIDRIKGMIGIRDCTQQLITLQMEDAPETEISAKQVELNTLYDAFSRKHGLINSQTNKRAFSQDSGYFLLCSLEKLDEEGKFKGKADMFSRRTIKKPEIVTSVDTSSEALAVSLSEKAKVDLDYMAQLVGKDIDTIKEELTGIIFQNPLTDKWETADEYLSGNVRDKLEIAESYAKEHPEFGVNVQALKQVQPKELEASEIEVRIGATWIEPKYIEDFMRDTFETPKHLFNRDIVGVQFSPVTGQWNVKGKNADYGNALVNMTYGTNRRNAYTILEDSLNLKDSRVYDTVIEDGKEKRVLNKNETMLASQKQEQIREAFKNWVFQDPGRRQALVEKYNKMFNSTRPREYDGAHLKFPGMTPDIELKPHQKNAVAHVLYGDNTLLAHCVGAGKTFEMTAAAMESKRLGLCRKSLFVVPNHLTEQWASDFLRLYPGAKILAATKKDFEPANRKKFCSRIATGDYDAVIIGHSQFEKIPLSQERQAAMIERQIDEIELAIEQAKADNGERYTIKQMEKSRKSLEVRLDKLHDTSRKDDVVTFEQLGVDRLFVDESHSYKNLFVYTKMRNVAGIAQTEAQKSSDMFSKCQYLDELTGGKGVTFATGTPISNSMTELYTNMRYLQYDTLQKLGLGQFDSWASSFGETQTAIELAPEGTGYRAKTRFAKFFNLPELISLFKESADIQTPDMLKLPVPEAEYENVVLKPSQYQQDMVSSLADRAEAVRNRAVEPNQDNMLKITNDGRKLALDQRLINPLLPDEEGSKVNSCVEKAFQIWEDTKAARSTQLIFCDLSTPKGDGTFNVYDDIKKKLMEKGVPENEIAFIHDANTELRKAELFGKVRSGQIRFLLGSTQKMGAGTNVQDRLIALHHLDVPWRPSDIEQQEGRILRQGNLNTKVKIFRYVTEGTFDSYSWQLIENKQKFIGQIMTSKSPVRSCEDIDDAALTYAEVKALATGNPYIKEKMDLDIQVSKLKLMKANHTSQKYRLEDNIAKHYPQQIAILKERISGMQADIQTAKQNLPADKEQFSMKVGDKIYTDKKEAGTAIVEMCKEMKAVNVPATIGEYAGFQMVVSFDAFNHKFDMNLKGQISHELEVGADPLGNITRINNTLESMTRHLAEAQTKLETVEHQLETAKVEVNKPFAQEEELAEKLERLATLNALLNMDERGEIAADRQMNQLSDRSAGRLSLKDKLAEMKSKVSVQSSGKAAPEMKKRKDKAL